MNSTSASLQGELPPLAPTLNHPDIPIYDMMYGAAAQPGLDGGQPKGQTKDGDEQRNRQQLPKTAPNGVAVERNGGGRQGRHGQSAFRKEQQKKRTGARVCPRFAPPATCAADALRARVFWPLGRR